MGSHHSGYQSGISEIDREHAYLIELLDDAEACVENHDTSRLDTILGEFSDKLREHFRHEEEMLQRAGYPHVQAHAKEHGGLLQKLLTMLDDPHWKHTTTRRGEQLEYLRAWLNDHILNQDLEAVEFLSSGTARPRPNVFMRVERLIWSIPIRFRVILLGLVPVGTLLLALLAVTVVRFDDMRTAQSGARLTAYLLNVSEAVHALQLERGASVLESTPDVREWQVARTRERVDDRFERIAAATADFDGHDHDAAARIEAIRDQVRAVRSALDHGTLDEVEVVDRYTAPIGSLMELAESLSLNAGDYFATHLALLVDLDDSKEAAGLERAIGAIAISRPVATASLHDRLVRIQERQRLHLEKITPPLLRRLGVAPNHLAIAAESTDLDHMRERIHTSFLQREPHGLDPLSWFRAASERIDQLQAVRHELVGDIQRSADDIRDDTERMAWLTAIFGSVFAALSLSLLWRVGNSIVTPAGRLAMIAQRLAEGKRLNDIPFTDLSDECGMMARNIAYLQRQLARGDLASATHRLKSEQRLLDIANSIPGVVYERTLDECDRSRMTFISEQIERYTGVPASALIGKPFDEFIERIVHPEDRNLVRTMWLTGAASVHGGGESEFRLVDHAGEALDVRVFFTDHVAPDGNRMRRGVAVDVTPLNKALAQLQSLSRLQSMSQLTGSLGHEINNMLGSIILGAGMAQRELADDDPLHRRLEQILDATNHARDLIANTLSFARGYNITREAIELDDVVEASVGLIGPLTPKNVLLRTSLDAADCRVVATRTELAQIIVNLSVNAFHALREGGGRLTISTKCVFGEPGGNGQTRTHARLFVEDDGPGIPAHVMPRLFEAFTTTKAPGQGSGMGLSLVRLLVENLGGRLDLDSEPGRGTRFDIMLPCAYADS